MLEETKKHHEHDPNFPSKIIDRINEFLKLDDIGESQEKHANFIEEMKLEVALININSPYSEVRAVVDNHDDPNTPCGTIRAWTIGVIFSIAIAFTNQLFSPRMPPIQVGANVAQLLCWPLGKAWEKHLPNWGFTLLGVRHNFNPGPFTAKEQMLITIMANVSSNFPLTSHLVMVQYLPQFFNQKYARSFSYQILFSLSTNFIGYGMAGIVRRFLVYPPWCVWPSSLSTIALNAAFHKEDSRPVAAPFRRTVKLSLLRFFGIAFTFMFVCMFSWMTWIAPDNVSLNAVAGFKNGIGFNPLPTFDWNILSDMVDPLQIPFFATFNRFIGGFVAGFIILAIWFTNTFNTAYLPINSNNIFDNTGQRYNVTRIINSNGQFNADGYQAYSFPFMTAASIVVLIFYFAGYPAAVVYMWLEHRHALALAYKGIPDLFWKRRRGKGKGNGNGDREGEGPKQLKDIHNRLMSAYTEVPEWWFTIVLVLAVACGVVAIVCWPTQTSPWVIAFGLLLCLLFTVPIGHIKAMTGVEIPLHVLAELLGSSLTSGNAMALNFLRSYGYVTTAHCLFFAQDLKLAHYVKIPPRQTFSAQMVGTLIATFVCTGLVNYQMAIPHICTPQAPDRFYCPLVSAMFSTSVAWGTIGPTRLFGSNGMYTSLLVGFPLGIVLPYITHYATKKFKKSWMRQINPVVMLRGAVHWAPHNVCYLWPQVPVAYLSWIWMKGRYLDLWSKYNFILSAAFSCAIATASIIIFFSLQMRNHEINWIGNEIVNAGCEGPVACTLLKVAKGQYFGPRLGEFP
ncbi:OPT oligopeptide transporter protein-domain-containing protein [Xylariaceae sp. FL0255]|nr:OPT oligopeptide transporter protein-domain-containing protein [Xylariaceae sp. FL0255]